MVHKLNWQKCIKLTNKKLFIINKWINIRINKYILINQRASLMLLKLLKYKKTLQGKHLGAILNCLVVFIASEKQTCITIVYLKDN